MTFRIPLSLGIKKRPTASLVVFACFWAVLLFLSCLANAYFWSLMVDQKTFLLLGIISVAAFLSALVTVSVIRRILPHKSSLSRFAASFILLFLGTAGLSTFGVALYNISYELSGISELFAIHTLLQIITFTAATGYFFMITTVKIFLPLALVSTFIAAAFCSVLSGKGV